MPSYSNGFVPASLLVVFNSGYNARDGHWTHSFPPATYARHLALIARARKRTGRTLALNYGWTAYRPFAAQRMLKRYYTSIGQPMMAATEGTSSHGGFWEGRQTMAGDYSNWAEVYKGFGGRAAFAEDCRAVGLLANMIVPSRGYPDEPWHVIDPNPWSAVPVFAGVVVPFHPTEATPEPILEEEPDMSRPFIIRHSPSPGVTRLYVAGPGIAGGLQYLTPEMLDVATAGYWNLDDGKPLFDELPTFDTKGNQRAFDVVQSIVADRPADVSEEEIAARVVSALSVETLAKKIVEYGIGQAVVDALTPQLAAIPEETADEIAERFQS